MHRSVVWVAAGLSVLLIGRAAIWMNRSSLPRVPLTDSSELRVLKISLGTNHVFSYENVWKQNLRRVLPQAWQKHLGPFQGERLRTSYDSLVVWIAEAVRPGGQGSFASFDNPGAVFADGTVAKGQIRPARAGIVGLQFDCFPRDRRQITLQVRKGMMVRFVVTNPQVAQAATWIERPLPQTNQSARTEVVLRELRGRRGFHNGEIDVLVPSRALGDGNTGWMACRVTAMDSWGNWDQGGWGYRGFPGVPALPLADSTWKLIVEGQEYLSAGFVPRPDRGTWHILLTNPRAQDLGVRFAMFVGPGSYRIARDGSAIASDASGKIPATPSLTFCRTVGETNWVLAMKSTEAGILCLTDHDPAGPDFHARLRERVGPDDGRIFRSPRVMAATNTLNGRKQIAQFFAPRLPDVTTNLEVEVIATLPPVDFFLTPPKP